MFLSISICFLNVAQKSAGIYKNRHYSSNATEDEGNEIYISFSIVFTVMR